MALTEFDVRLTEMQLQLQFQQEEEEVKKLGLPAKHKVMPSMFIMECLQVEEDQYVFYFFDAFGCVLSVMGILCGKYMSKRS
jgi:hypothetical protein